MSYLTNEPNLMLELLAVMVKRAGGSVRIESSDAPGPFNLLSKWEEDGSLLLKLDEGEQVARQTHGAQAGTA